MSYTVTISGHTDTPDAEATFVTALEGFVADQATPAGITSAQGFFQTAGTVNLLSNVTPPPVDDPEADLDEALKALDDKLAEVFTSTTAPTDVTAEDADAILTLMADVQTAAAAYETSVTSLGNSPSSSTGSSTPSTDTPAAGAPASPSTSPTGTGTADAPTLSTGDAVSL